ncbi:TetR/AcrR family transcriptional regulator [Xenophilus sp. Marseille-Q4582]|uniref:TetR/AcrR family transcriptional regulator n=1 Tax=Xenophilus sp. Marseille-Q4582 TaxID=2866600 RepID=UPI001CE3DA47|nr:TetR/AcrR family transcriptional regulator [Xenophilus sp. Marseille-Q4582]
MSALPTVTETRLRDAERSQAAILLAARDEFAGHGLAGARVDRIAERAQVNKRLIYYYFHSKDDLFLAVLEQAYADIRAAERELHLTDMPPAQAIRRLTEFTWEYYLAHPEFLTLLNSENLHQGRHVARSARAREMNSPLIDTLAQILERGRAEGIFRGGIDPVQLYVSIAGMAYFYLSNNHTLSAIFGRSLMTPKAQHERISHMCDVILGYVLKG